MILLGTRNIVCPVHDHASRKGVHSVGQCNDCRIYAIEHIDCIKKVS